MVRSSRGVQLRRILLGAAVSAALAVTGGVSAAAASDEEAAPGAPALGGFALGDGIAATIDRATGALSVEADIVGLPVAWDSRIAGVDRLGLGAGWSIGGLVFVDVEGGVRVVTATGQAYDHDASAPNGLHGYPRDDLRFARAPGVLPARRDGLAGERAYEFTLTALGGSRTYLDASGDPVASVDRLGTRLDWEWADGHGLTRVIDGDGVVVDLDRRDDERIGITRFAGAAAGAHRTELTAEIELAAPGASRAAGAGVGAIVDAAGGRTEFVADDHGVIRAIRGSGGATALVDWRVLHDARVAVERLTIRDDTTGRRLGERAWSARSGSVSGWPVRDAGSEVTGGSGSAVPLRTELTDGPVRVSGEYDDRGRLMREALTVGVGAGPSPLRESWREYPSPESVYPGRLTITHRDPATGATRTVEERYVSDALGRVTEHTGVDGTVTTTRYDDRAGPLGVPIGLVVGERTLAPDGLVSEVRNTLDDAYRAIVVTESFAGSAESLVRTAREERALDVHGAVTELRTYEQGGGGTPRIARWQRTADPVAGRVTVAETVAAGTAVAATTTEVSDAVLGAPVASTDAMGRVTTTEYDEAGRPIRQIAPGGRVTSTVYRTGARGGVHAVARTGPDGVTHTEERDGLGRAIRFTDDLATTDDRDAEPVTGHERVRETRAYPAPGVVEVTDAWGATSTRRTDVFGRVVEAAAPGGLAEATVYDDVRHTRTAGLTPSGDLADAEVTRVEQLDERDRVCGTSGARADGRSVVDTTRVVDGLGRTTATADGATETDVTLDEYGNPRLMAAAPSGGESSGATIVAERRFDGFGSSVEKVISDGVRARSGGARTVDQLGRTVSVTDQHGRTTTTAYAPDGQVDRVVEASGRVTEHEYDEATGELVSTVVTSPLGDAVHTAYEHDPATGAVTAVFDPRDRAGTLVGSTFDGHGNPTSVTYPDGKRIRHRYDEHGRLRSTTDVSGATTTFSYDPAGALIEALQIGRDGAELARVAYETDEFGRTTRIRHGNGVVSEYTFTSASEIESETTTGPDGAVQVEREYAYDARGNLVRRTDTVPRLEPAAGREPAAERGTVGDSVTTMTAYRYDAHDRLVGSTVYDGADERAPRVRETGYEVTGAGDLAEETVTERSEGGDACTTVRRFEYDAAGALTGVTTTGAGAGGTHARDLSYDATGALNRTSDGASTDYDAAGRPVVHRAADGTETRTSYWATGQPRATTTSAGTVVRYWDGPTLVNDADPEAGSVASYLFGSGRHARSIQTGSPGAPTDTSYYGLDRHGSVATLTDARGEVTTEYSYTDYGTVSMRTRNDPVVRSPLDRNPFQFAGEYTNRDGTQHLNVRTYDPDLARFTSPDPADRHNRYNFADLNPITLTDPSGRTPQVDSGLLLSALGMAGAIIGFISSLATGGAVLPMIANGLVGLFDVGVAIAMEVGRANPGAISEQTTLTLGGVAFLAGLATLVAPFFLGGVPPAKGPAGRLADRTDEQWIALRDYDSHADFVTSRGQRAQLVALFPEIHKIQIVVKYFARFLANETSASISLMHKGMSNLDRTLESLKHILTLRFPNTAHAVAKVWRVGVTDQWPSGRYILPSDVTLRIIAYAQDSSVYLHSSEGVAQLFRHEIAFLRTHARPRFVGAVVKLIDEISDAEQDLRVYDRIW